ncbi:MAG: molybdopterin-binding protein [Caldilineales bacterium]|nr:molybdopterin-binding protein [Caldilineales bacterium]MDW8317326.1 molybdopterin-binding protein [Anaerolineae bacterium]
MPELFAVHTPPEAWRLFSARFQPTVRAETISTYQALGRVLAEDLYAPHDLPTFPRSTVDGYAVAAADTYGASPSLPAYLEVVGEVGMGQAADLRLAEGQAALVHTGGMIPPDADAVVMVEHTQQVDPSTIEVYRPVAVGQNVIQVGEDIRQGELVLPAGHRLRPQDIGGLVALGIVRVPVAVRPRVAILSQGDEVVPPEQFPGPGQVRDINSYTLAALAQEAGALPITYPIVPDRLEALQEAAGRALAEADVLVMSAGSSVSARDMTAQVVEGLGRPGILVHGLSIKPGKPTIIALCDGKPVFGLPGNPVSAMVIFRLFVTPTIYRLLGTTPPDRPRVRARMARNVASTTGREDYVQVRLEERRGELWAVPVLGKSNLIYTLVRSQGTVKIDLDSNGVAEGEWVTVEL